MACVSNHNVLPFIGRKKTPTQNVMCVTDFDLCFTFVCSGWEGSAHDSRIFTSTINDPVMRFPTPAEGSIKSSQLVHPNLILMYFLYNGMLKLLG
jgi:hypothetical protein